MTQHDRPDTTLVVPVRHEEGSVGPLLDRLSSAFRGRQVEVVFVDDSDNPLTGDAIHAHLDSRGAAHVGGNAAARARSRRAEHLLVHHIHRIGSDRWGGLSGAVIDGFRHGSGEVILTMDADLQHPPETAPTLVEQVEAGTDIVVASRYIPGGSNDGLDGFRRRLVSKAATLLTRILFPRGLRGVTDPMTGFFAFKRSEIDIDKLSNAEGFKILLELLTAHPDATRAEVPLQFQQRHDGQSKTDEGNGLKFLKQLFRLRVQTMPTFVNFVMGGGLVAVIGALMLAGLIWVGVEPHLANAIQLVTTLVLNFLYNRHVTWRGKKGRRLHWQMLIFGITRGATMVLSWSGFVGLMIVGERYGVLSLGWRAQAANALTLVAGTILNYLTSKYMVFAGRDNDVASRKRVRKSATVPLAVLAMFVGTMLILSGLFGFGATAIGFILVYAIFGAITGGLEVRWRLYARRTPEAQQAMKFDRPDETTPQTTKYSIILPALREERVIGNTVRHLLQQTYPNTEIVATLSEGDDATIAAVRAVLPEADGRLRILVKKYENGSKPAQMNEALKVIGSDFVTVADAETLFHPRFVELANATLHKRGADVLQGGVQLMNMAVPQPLTNKYNEMNKIGKAALESRDYVWWQMRSWFCVHNVMEYAFWFDGRMPYQVDLGFVPLGGNTVVIRRDLLVKAGGWPINLTEDCALGVKLSTLYNAKVVACYEPEFASREETPSHIFGKGGLDLQRTRWDQGFWSVLMEGEWLKLPTLRQRVMALYILAMPLIQAVNGVMLPTALAGILLLTAPAPLVLVMFLPIMMMLLTIAIQVVGLRTFSKNFGVKVRLRNYASLIFLNLPYQALLAIPAIRSLYRYYKGNNKWESTAHFNTHVAMETRQHALVG